MNELLYNNHITLHSFFIFDPTLKPISKKPTDEEIIEAQIIYYYPVNESMYQQRSNCGLVNGTYSVLNMFENKKNILSNFIIVELSNKVVFSKEVEFNKFICLIIEKENNNNFHKNEEYKRQYYNILIDHLYKTLIFYHGPISNFKNIIEIDNSLKTNNNSAKTNKINIERKINSCNYLLNYKDDNSFSNYNKATDNRKKLDCILTDFIENYIKNLNEGNNLGLIFKISYFPLNETNYLDILYSSRRLKEKYNFIEFASIIYNGFLIHNEINLDIISILYSNFYSNLDNSPKFKKFSLPPYKVVQTIYGGYNPSSGNSLESHGSTKYNQSSFAKAFDGVENYQLFGISPININNYQIFIPVVYLYNIKEYYKMLVINRENTLFFLFLKNSFDPKLNISKILNIEKLIKKYFEHNIQILKDINSLRLSNSEKFDFMYSNKANNSIKLSSYFSDKQLKMLTLANSNNKEYVKLNNHFNYLLSILSKGGENYVENKIAKLEKNKGILIYSISILNRKIHLFIKPNKDIKELKNTLNEFKLQIFDHIFSF